MKFNQLLYLIACMFVAIIAGCSEPVVEPIVEPSSTEESKAVSSESLPSRVTAAGTHFSEGRYTDTIEIAEELVKEFPGNTTYWFLLGEAAFMAGDIERSCQVFDRLVEINPKMKPSFWQRGLVLYYAEKFEEGVDQFTVHQTVNTQDVENSVWHLMCLAKTIGVEEARKQMIPIEFDTRPAMAEIFKMFAGEVQPQDVIKAAESAIVSSEQDRNTNLYYAHLYTGLYYEMIGQPEDSIASMKEALAVAPDEKGILMAQVAKVHLQVRGVETQQQK